MVTATATPQSLSVTMLFFVLSRLLVLLSGVLAALWIKTVEHTEYRDGFDDEWPPISDDEFLQRYAAMVGHPVRRADVVLRVREIISEATGIPRDQIYPEQRFLHDLGF